MMMASMMAEQNATELPFGYERIPKLPPTVVIRDGTEKENIRMFEEN